MTSALKFFGIPMMDWEGSWCIIDDTSITHLCHRVNALTSDLLYFIYQGFK